jgi:hypothetical protein
MLENRSKEQKYFDVKKKQLEVIEQSIHVTDILMQHNPAPLYDYSYDFDRLLRQLKFLIDTTDYVHTGLYADPKDFSKAKPGFENHITRFISNECSFFCPKHPMGLSNFTRLLRELDLHLSGLNQNQGCNQNIIFVFSSFNVIDDDQRVYNVVLYIQGGKKPQINTLAKITPLINEIPAWANHGSFQNMYIRNKDGKYSYLDDINPNRYEQGSFTLLGPDKSYANWNYHNIFVHTTLGGAKHVTLIDICLDHFYKNAKYNYIQMINRAQDSQETDFIPTQVSHIITSNYMQVIEASTISRHTTLVDPSLFIVPELNTSSLQTNFSPNNLIYFFASKQVCAVFNGDTNLFEIGHQDFEISFYLSVNDSYTLAKPNDGLLERIHSHNQRILRNYKNNYYENLIIYRKNKTDYFLLSNFFNYFLNWLAPQKLSENYYQLIREYTKNQLKHLTIYLEKPEFSYQLSLMIRNIIDFFKPLCRDLGITLAEIAKEGGEDRISTLFQESIATTASIEGKRLILKPKQDTKKLSHFFTSLLTHHNLGIKKMPKGEEDFTVGLNDDENPTAKFATPCMGIEVLINDSAISCGSGDIIAVQDRPTRPRCPV